MGWTKNSNHILEQATNLPNYNRWIISLFTNHFKGNLLEIGSGLGGLSIFLPQNATLSDIQPKYLSFLKSHFKNKVINLNIESETSSNKYDTIFSSNVFEHLKNDQKALENCFKILNSRGTLLLFVPAKPEICGELDKAMGHYRRYTKEEIIKKAQKAGFSNISAKYVNMPGYFTWWARGRFKSKSSDGLFSTIFDKIITPFLYLEKFINLPLGQSLILIAEKP